MISGSKKSGIEGTSEFGFVVNGQDMRADIVAARWHDQFQIEAIAVECKRLGTMVRSLGAGLWQAIDYQVAFDKVFIATEFSGEAGNKRSVIESLGIGHIGVNMDSGICQVILDGELRNGDRFNESVRSSQVTSRLAMFLAFRDALGTPVRYGETFAGGGYIAKNMGANIQYNCWIDSGSGKSYFGINIEHIDSFRKILRSTDWNELGRCLRELDGHSLTLVKDPVPAWRSPESKSLIGTISCCEVNIQSLQKSITEVVEDLPRHWRPHLTISAPLWKYNESLFREACVSKVNVAKNKLSRIMIVFITSI